jgi:tRNA (guanine-N7-)-methyltransferase
LSKGKLQKFGELNSFSNVLQPTLNEVLNTNYFLKGKWNQNFFLNDNPIVLELGCGKGEYTVELAKRIPGKNFLGVDIKGARMWKGAKIALEESLQNAAFLRTRIDFIESFFARNEIHEIWITFPDPQPRKRLKRLTSSRFLNRYRKFLNDKGTIHLKTDDAELYRYTKMLAEFNQLPIEFATENLYNPDCADDILSIKTYYENMWLQAGMPIHYLRFRLFSDQSIIEPPDEFR